MRSRELAQVPKAGQRQAKELCLRNINFIRDSKTLDHSSASLHLANCVLVTFEQQKNDRKANTLTQWWTQDKLLCPVKIWALITRKILSYNRAKKNSPVSLVKHKNMIINVTVDMIADLC